MKSRRVVAQVKDQAERSVLQLAAACWNLLDGLAKKG